MPDVYRSFICSQTPQGNRSFTDELLNPETLEKAVLLKGSAGSGKSTFIKRTVCTHLGKDEKCELFYCSGDITSLDGAVLWSHNTAILDATEPHSIEPKYPCAFEKIISMYDLYDCDKLHTLKDQIISAQKQEKNHRKRYENFIRAGGMLLLSNESISRRSIDETKLENYIERLGLRLVKKQNQKGILHKRFLSTLTPDGVAVFFDTIQKHAKTIYAICDEYGAVSGKILKHIENLAIENGHEVFSFVCPMSHSGKIDHLLLPKIGLGFVTSNSFHPYTKECKKIRISRFLNREYLDNYTYRMNFQKRTARELLAEAAKYKQKALEAHTLTEALYASAVIEQKREELVQKEIANLF